MFTRIRLVAALAALAATAAVPAAAQAKKVELRGVVSGSPYGASGGQMAIPVLFSKITSREAGLKSPVGVIIVKRTQRVKLPNGAGSALPVNLRTGDRFKGVGDVNSLQQRVFYPRVVFSKPVVYFRSKELSLAELSAAVDSLRKALADLQNQLNALRGASLAAFQSMLAELAALKAQLAALKIPEGVDLTSLQAQIDSLKSSFDALVASLPDFSQFALLSQIPSLTGYVTLTDLTTTLAGYATTAYVDGQIAGLQSQIDALPTATEVTNEITTAVTGLASTAYVDGQVATVKAKVNEVVAGYSALCSQLETVATLTAVVDCPAVTALP